MNPRSLPPPSHPPAAPGQPTARSGMTPARVIPFRRRAVKTRWRRRSRFMPWLRLSLLALVFLVLPASSIHWALTSPYFGLAKIEIVGLERVSRSWVEGRIASVRGDNLLLLPLGDLSRALDGHPWIEGLEITKELPHRLRLEVVERRPVALVERQGRLFWADAGGRLIEAWDGLDPAPGASPADDLLVVADRGIQGGVSGALAMRAELIAARPEWGLGVSRVEVLGERDFELATRALPYRLRLRAGAVAAQVHWLEALLPELERRSPGFATVDLRFDRRLIVLPGTDPGGGET